MRIDQLEIQNFRGYEKLNLKLEPGINVFVGKNGAGKTNLAEAIFCLSIARSFRTSDEKEMRKQGESIAKLKGLFFVGESKVKVEMLLTSKGKKIVVNGSEIKTLSELVSECHVLVFKPSDTFLFDDSPLERRKLVNQEISRQSKKYLSLIRKYEKILYERNSLLKEENFNEIQLAVLTEQMIDVSKEIIRLRSLFFEKLKPIVERLSYDLTKGYKRYEFKYRSFVSLVDYEKNAQNAFLKAKENDLRYKATTIGVHREDFEVLLNGVNIVSSGSQGEKRLAALILKMAIYELVKDVDKKPILILDDVLSELDDERQDSLLNVISKYDQVVITTTEWNKGYKAAVYDVVNHKVIRRITYGR